MIGENYRGASALSLSRPPFSPSMTVEAFSAAYWQKHELAAICRQHGLRADGTKAELQTRIKKFLRTGKIGIKSKRARSATGKRTYQWNGFVRDFNRDPRTRSMANRMQVAALLWRAVKDRPGSKMYSSKLLDEFADEVAKISASKS